MKKKISLLLCVLLVAICFVGCSDKEEGLSKDQKDSMQGQSQILFEMCSGMTDEKQYDEFMEYLTSLSEYEMNNQIFEMNNMLQGYQMGPKLQIDAETYINVFSSWKAALEECGEFKELKDEFEVDEEKLTVSAEVVFEKESQKREATVMFSFDEDGRVQSLDVSAHYDTGEILTKAGLNTLLGMGTVFAVLIFLALIISAMKFVPMLLEKPAKKTTSDVEEKTVIAETVEVEASDDLELIAVITAAIAAQEGTSTDGFVVRSIRRRPSNNWN